jgi:hypothetical protein
VGETEEARPESGGHEGGVAAQLIYRQTEALVGTLIDTDSQSPSDIFVGLCRVCGQLTILYRPDSPHREDYLGFSLGSRIGP